MCSNSKLTITWSKASLRFILALRRRILTVVRCAEWEFKLTRTSCKPSFRFICKKLEQLLFKQKCMMEDCHYYCMHNYQVQKNPLQTVSWQSKQIPMHAVTPGLVKTFNELCYIINGLASYLPENWADLGPTGAFLWVREWLFGSSLHCWVFEALTEV